MKTAASNKKFETKKSRWMQPSIGVMVITLFLVPVIVWQLISNATNSTAIILMTLGGIFLGYSLSRSKFGFNGPIKKMVQNGDGRQAKALIYLFMIGSVIAGGAMLVFGQSAFSDYPTMVPLGIGTIIGGLLFGVGMILATGCASGTLTDAGDGILPAIVVLIFFMLGSTFGVAFYGSAADKVLLVPKGTDTSLAAATGSISIGLIINMLLLAVILSGVVLFHKFRKKQGTQNLFPLTQEALVIGDAEIESDEKLGFWKSIFTFEKYKKIFMTRWTWIMGVIAVATWFTYVVFIVPPYDVKNNYHETAGITGAYAKWGIWLTQGFGIDKITSWGGYKNFNLIHDTQSWQNFGIVIGASAAKLSQNRFRITGIKQKKVWHWALFALGGLFMGLGARLARGCNFGALFTGVTFGTGFGWIFGIFLFSSAALTAVVTKKIRYNTPNSAYGKKGGYE